MLKIRWSHDHLIFNMGIPKPGKDSLYIETGPGISIVGIQDRSSLDAIGKASQAKFISCGMEHHPLVTCAATPAH